MEIIVHGRNVQLDSDLQAEVTERITHAGRVFDSLDSVDVEVSEEPNPRRSDERFHVELTARAVGRVVRIESGAATIESAFDDAIDRLTRQARRLKERLIDRNRRATSVPEPGDGGDETEAPEIVRVKQFVIKPMTLEEATLQMDMLGHSFFFFTNAENDQPSVLYRRRDGRLGLIESA